MENHFETTEISWHPGFCSAMELELMADTEALEFLREYPLSKEPLRMDLLIIRKLPDVAVHNEIGRMFKTYNIVEYKCPGDGLSIDDYYKTVGYACLYKGLGDKVDEIPAAELTVSIFREQYPRKLFHTLKTMGFSLEEPYAGVFYVRGERLLDIQIIVISLLDRKTHGSLRLLSRNVE